jgi:peptidyl-dipeptidase Dcp
MTSNIGSDDYNEVDTDCRPMLSAAGDEITFNERLFAAHQGRRRRRRGCRPDRRTDPIATRSRDSFVRNGAALDAAGKAELGRINTALANAFTSFGQKVVADENTWTVIPTEAGVAGLPASNKAAAAAAARSRNVQGWAIVNTRSSVDPFLSFADDRGLREVVWRKFVNRGDNGDRNDTNATIAEIVKLRQDRARLLGFGNHAEWRMQDTMAKTPRAAMDLMNRVWAPAKARVTEEVADMRAIAGHDIEPWDYLYYAEKVRKQKYDLDQNELKPYFELNNVRAGSFEMARRLYGFTFDKLPAGAVPGLPPGRHRL